MSSLTDRAGSRRIVIAAIAVLTTCCMAACTSYRDPRAEVIITSNRGDAEIYLVPISVEVAKPPTRSALQEYAMGRTSSRGIWVDHGRYWLLLEKDGMWSQPVEFEVRLDYLNKAHVEF